MQKFCVIIDRIIYMNLYFDESNEIYNYSGLLQCSDGTSSALLRIEGRNILDLNKFKINVKKKINNKNNIDNKVRIYPFLEESIQLIIIGNPIMENVKELSILDIYDEINLLKKYKNKDGLLNFDLILTKYEFTSINGSFLRNSSFLKSIPVIKVFKYFSLDEYINLIDLNNKKEEKI